MAKTPQPGTPLTAVQIAELIKIGNPIEEVYVLAAEKSVLLVSRRTPGGVVLVAPQVTILPYEAAMLMSCQIIQHTFLPQLMQGAMAPVGGGGKEPAKGSLINS
jgi:hypothetical protein